MGKPTGEARWSATLALLAALALLCGLAVHTEAAISSAVKRPRNLAWKGIYTPVQINACVGCSLDEKIRELILARKSLEHQRSLLSKALAETYESGRIHFEQQMTFARSDFERIDKQMKEARNTPEVRKVEAEISKGKETLATIKSSIDAKREELRQRTEAVAKMHSECKRKSMGNFPEPQFVLDEERGLIDSLREYFMALKFGPHVHEAMAGSLLETDALPASAEEKALETLNRARESIQAHEQAMQGKSKDEVERCVNIARQEVEIVQAALEELRGQSGVLAAEIEAREAQIEDLHAKADQEPMVMKLLPVYHEMLARTGRLAKIHTDAWHAQVQVWRRTYDQAQQSIAREEKLIGRAIRTLRQREFKFLGCTTARRSADPLSLTGGSESSDSTWNAECPKGLALVGPYLREKGTGSGDIELEDYKCCTLEHGWTEKEKCTTAAFGGEDESYASCPENHAAVGIFSRGITKRVALIKCCPVSGGIISNTPSTCTSRRVDSAASTGGTGTSSEDLWNSECPGGSVVTGVNRHPESRDIESIRCCRPSRPASMRVLDA